MKKQLLGVFVGLGLILGSTTFVGAMNEESKKKASDMKNLRTTVLSVVNNELSSLQRDRDIQYVWNLIALITTLDIFSSNSFTKASEAYQKAGMLQMKLNGSFVDSSNTALTKDDITLAEKLNDKKEQRNTYGFCTGAAVGLGFGGAGFICGVTGMMFLALVLLQGLLAGQVAEKTLSNKYVVAALKFFHIDEKKFADVVMKFVKKAREDKSINMQQKDGSRSIVLIEFLAGIGLTFASVVFFAAAVIPALVAGGCARNFFKALKAEIILKKAKAE